VLVQHVSLKPQTTHASIPPQVKPPPPPLPDIPSIAVLPFANQSGDPNQEYLSNGISDQLINDLSRLPGLFVIARNSSFAYKGKDVREHQIGTELGVKYLLEGSVQKAADRVRIEVQLVDASSGTEEWTQRFDRPFTDIFAMQDEIVGKVVTTVGLISNLDRLRLGHLAGTPSTDNLEAYQDFLRAIEYYRRFTKDDNAQARQWLDKAIALDPKFSAAYSFLGSAYWIDVWSQWSGNPQVDLKRSAELAHKALSLDDSNSDALALLSRVDWMQRQFDQAVIDAQRAVAINPNSAAGYQALADAESSASRPEESLHAAEQAIRLDPAARDLDGYMLGTAYAEMRRYTEAVAVLKRCIAAYPNLLVAHFSLLAAYSEMGDDQDARAEATEVMRISPHFVLSKQGVFKDAAANERWYKSARKAGLK
jgi:adenylate cyclase